MTAEKPTLVPPDGKWGWMIVLAYALNGMCTTSLLHGFGLIFKDMFPLLGFNATEGAIIINANLAFGMVLGLINGPLLRIFGYRKMAVIGSLFYSTGIIMTTFARSFAVFMLFYGICASLGTCITMSAFSYALNSYFTTKRGRAMSLAVTIIGFGPIVIPQITTFLVLYYGFQGTMLLFGAFSLHSLVGSLLLHPLKWHTKNVTDESGKMDEELSISKNGNKNIDEKNSILREESQTYSALSLNDNIQRRRKTTISSIDHDAEIGSIYGFDISYARQQSETLCGSLTEKELEENKISEDGQIMKERRRIDKSQFKSIDTINLDSCIKIFEEKSDHSVKYNDSKGCEANNVVTMENDKSLEENGTRNMLNIGTNHNDKYEKRSTLIRVYKVLNDYFDFDLLRDPIYVNMMLGMSIAIFAEINFSQLTPFILMDMKLSTKQIATVMSVIASVDLVFRSLAPFFGEWLNQPPRIMYLFSLCLLVISRTSLLIANGFYSIICIAVGLGVAKGFRSVYMSLVIPSYVPIHRLPNASGIQMIVNGMIFLCVGPILGVMRDNIGNYTPSIIMINCVTLLTVIMWTVEIIIRRRNSRIKAEEQS